MKNHYQMPTIKVVAFQVEGGFQASRHKIGEATPLTETDYGTQRFGKEVWYQDPSSSSSEG